MHKGRGNRIWDHQRTEPLHSALLESDLCHPTCAIRAATAGGNRGKVRKISEAAGQR